MKNVGYVYTKFVRLFYEKFMFSVFITTICHVPFMDVYLFISDAQTEIFVTRICCMFQHFIYFLNPVPIQNVGTAKYTYSATFYWPVITDSITYPIIISLTARFVH